jgi:hypothetical protein
MPICVYQQGPPQTCPTSFSHSQTIVYTGPLDQTGTCTACSCTVTEPTCAPAVKLYSDGACTAQVAPTLTFNGTQCFSAGTIKSAELVSLVTPVGGSCGAGGKATLMGGSAAGTAPVTVCCTQ